MSAYTSIEVTVWTVPSGGVYLNQPVAQRHVESSSTAAIRSNDRSSGDQVELGVW
jgi:hypothetical protein